MFCLSLIATASISLFSVPQTKSIYDQVVQHPDLNNGYCDYVRGADLVSDPSVTVYGAWSPKQYDQALEDKSAMLATDPRSWTAESEKELQLKRHLHELDYLGVQREFVKNYGRALDLVRLGNTKQVYDPRDKVDVNTTFPELGKFRSLARLLTAESYVRFADGKSSEGTADLLDGVIFAHKIGGTTLLAELVSSACSSIIMSAFEDRRVQLSDKDSLQVQRFVDSVLADPPSYVQALKRERSLIFSALDPMFGSPVDKSLFGDSDQSAAIAAAIQNLNPVDRQGVKANLKGLLDTFFNGLIQQLSQPEATWMQKNVDDILPTDPASISSPIDLVDTLARNVLPSYQNTTRAVLRTRTQMRLLGLHARILDFRWKNHHLPSNLKEIAKEDAILDPLSGTEFQYELREDGYKLYSRGADGTGPVELRYKAPANAGGVDKQDIPPLAAGIHKA